MQLSRKILAGALIALLPLGSALACTTAAWTTTTPAVGVAGSPVADDPDASGATNGPTDAGHAKRYSGNCGLAPASGVASHVTNDTPGTEGVYRARVYFFTGITTGAPRFLEATSADAGGGSSIFSVTYDRAAGTGGSLTFTANGTTVPAIPLPAANRWYSVEVLHQTGAPLQVSVEGANSAVADNAPLTATSAGNVAGTVGSARLGNLNSAPLGFQATPAANNNFGFAVDEFDSTRSAATPIGRLCRGDANNNANTQVGDNDLSALDAGAIVAEALGTSVAPGQPDVNEDGRVTALDAGAVIAMRLANKKCN